MTERIGNDVESIITNALSVKKYFEERGQDIVHGLMMMGVVGAWVASDPPNAKRIAKQQEANGDNIALLEPLWMLCLKHGLRFGTRDKVRLFRDYLDHLNHRAKLRH